MVTISFPGLGIEPFEVNSVAFTIPIFGGIEVRWYGLIITLGIILAFSYCAYRAKREGIIFDHVLDIALFTVIFGVLGARAYYVLTTLKTHTYENFIDVIAIWEGGLAIYGGIIAGALTIFFVCRHKKINPLKMLDATAPGVMIGQLLGRWGNFFNGEAYGSEVFESNFMYFLRMGLVPNIESSTTMHYFHPTFLYESLWNLTGFILIHFLYKKKKFDGQVLLMYLTWYGFGRMLIESLRTDSLYVGVFRISQVIGFLCFVIGMLLLIINLLKARRIKLTEQEYAPTYPKMSIGFTTEMGNEPASTEASEEASDEAPDDKMENTDEAPDEEESEDVEEIEEKESIEKRFYSLFDQDDSNKDTP